MAWPARTNKIIILGHWIERAGRTASDRPTTHSGEIPELLLERAGRSTHSGVRSLDEVHAGFKNIVKEIRTLSRNGTPELARRHLEPSGDRRRGGSGTQRQAADRADAWQDRCLVRRIWQAATLLADNGYFSAANVTACQAANIEPLIALGRQGHHQSLRERFAALPPRTDKGSAWSRAKCTELTMSETLRQRAINAGRLSTIAFHMRRASS